jgi:hypothetical protein
MKAYPISLASLVVLGALLVMTVALLFDKPGPRYPSAQTHWIYGPRQTLGTGQEGVIVYCQGKTNSRAFAERKHATPGDVVIQTCRAVRAPEAS